MENDLITHALQQHNTPSSRANDGVEIAIFSQQQAKAPPQKRIKRLNRTSKNSDGVEIHTQRQLSFDFSYQEKRTYQGIDVFEWQTNKGQKILSVQSNDGIILSVPGTFNAPATPTPMAKVKNINLSEPLPPIQTPNGLDIPYPTAVVGNQKADLRHSFKENAQKIT